MVALVSSNSCTKAKYSAPADCSLMMSSWMDWASYSLSSSNLVWTFSKAAGEKVEAIWTSAKIGFEPPILDNSAITASLSSWGWMVENFSMIKSSAFKTLFDYSCLMTKSSASLALESFRSISLWLRRSSWMFLFLISASMDWISALRVAISDSALEMVVVEISILLLYSLISFSHSASWMLCKLSASDC